jgi:hypothetical protein
MSLQVAIGYDSRERDAYYVAEDSLWRTSGIRAHAVKALALTELGILDRPVDMVDGRMVDRITGLPQSTEFAIARFLVPLLCSSGWCLFTDCDVVFMRDVRELVSRADPSKAVMVVKHAYEPVGYSKMDGQVQRHYPRKNWSSVVLWNVDHHANRRLTRDDVNKRHRDWLHGFEWLSDDEIGTLPPEWNWLVNEQPKPAQPAIAHFTRGGPFTRDWPGAEHDEIWREAFGRMVANGGPK